MSLVSFIVPEHGATRQVILTRTAPAATTNLVVLTATTGRLTGGGPWGRTAWPPGGLVAAATAIESAAGTACAGGPGSLALTVKLDVPGPVGVPEMRPVAGSRRR